MRDQSPDNGASAVRRRLLPVAVVALFGFGSASAADSAAVASAFLRDYCTTCHNGESKRGGLDLTSLTFDGNDPAKLGTRIKLHDLVQAGEMPPRGRARPDATRQKDFLNVLHRSIATAELAALAGEGRAVLRRLNRDEYENALRDLLHVPWAQIAGGSSHLARSRIKSAWLITSRPTTSRYSGLGRHLVTSRNPHAISAVNRELIKLFRDARGRRHAT